MIIFWSLLEPGKETAINTQPYMPIYTMKFLFGQHKLDIRHFKLKVRSSQSSQEKQEALAGKGHCTQILLIESSELFQIFFTSIYQIEEGS